MKICKNSVFIHNGPGKRRGWVCEVQDTGRTSINVLYLNEIEQGYNRDWFEENMVEIPAHLYTDNVRSRTDMWIVWSPQADKNPVVTHASSWKAGEEARRLSAKTGINFFSAKVIGMPKADAENHLADCRRIISQGEEDERLEAPHSAKLLKLDDHTTFALTPEQARAMEKYCGQHAQVIEAIKMGGNYYKAERIL